MIRKLFKRHISIWGAERWIVAVIGLTIMLSSCVEEIENKGKGTGKKIEVTFILDSYNYEDSEQSAETRAVAIAEPEKVVVGLGDGWVSVASFSKDEEEITTRAKTSGTTRLTTGSKLMIVAYESTTPTIVEGQAEYVVNPDGSISPTGGGLWVMEDLDYRFVAYSYDKSYLPDPANIDPTEDLLWGCFPENVNNFHRVTEVSNLIGIKLEHLFSSVKVRATVQNGSIQAISGVTMTGKPTTTVTLLVPAGTFTGSGNTFHDITFNAFSATSSILSNTAIAWTVSNPQVRIGSININGTVHSNIPFNFSGTTLAAGNSYTLAVQFNRITFAISPATINIPFPAQAPVAQTISITPSPSTASWTLTSNSQAWLRLNTNGGASGTQTASGTGPATVYMVADLNTGSARSAGIYLNGASSDVRVTVNQAAFPYTLCGGLYVTGNYSAIGYNIINGIAPCPDSYTRLPNSPTEMVSLINGNCFYLQSITDYLTFQQPWNNGNVIMWYRDGLPPTLKWRQGSWDQYAMYQYNIPYRCIYDP